MSPHAATDPLTAEESQTLAEAMLELAEQGQHDAVAELGKLAHDPAALRQILSADDVSPATSE